MASIIKGTVAVENIAAPYPFLCGISLNLSGSMDGGTTYIDIGSVGINAANGNFQVETNHTFQPGDSIQYQFYSGTNLLHQAISTLNIDLEIVVNMPQNVYEDLIENADYVTVKGRFTFGNAQITTAPVDSHSATVILSKAVFRNQEIIAELEVDDDSRFCFKTPRNCVLASNRLMDRFRPEHAY